MLRCCANSSLENICEKEKKAKHFQDFVHLSMLFSVQCSVLNVWIGKWRKATIFVVNRCVTLTETTIDFVSKITLHISVYYVRISYSTCWISNIICLRFGTSAAIVDSMENFDTHILEIVCEWNWLREKWCANLFNTSRARHQRHQHTNWTGRVGWATNDLWIYACECAHCDAHTHTQSRTQ